MSDLTFGPARPGETEDLLLLLKRAFRVDPGTERERATHRLVRSDLAQFVVLRDYGEVVAAAHVARHDLRVGEAVVRKADVGHVAVTPERQGCGLGTELMTRLHPFLATEGYHFARLGGLMPFYSRFGYEPFPRRYLEITVPDLAAPLKGRTWGEWLAPTSAERRSVRAYCPDLDGPDVLRLGNLRPLALALVSQHASSLPLPPPLRPLSVVYDHGGELRAFAWAEQESPTATASGNLGLRQLLWDPAAPHAAAALVRHLLHHAAQRGLTMRTRLPYDAQLCEALTADGITFELREMRQAVDGNMVRLIDLESLCQALAPEFAARLRSVGLCPRSGLSLAVGGRTATLPAGLVSGLPPVRVSQSTFLRWALGLETPAETNPPVPPEHRLLLLVLFPRFACVSDTWG